MKAQQIKTALTSIENSYSALLDSFVDKNGQPTYTKDQANRVSQNLLKQHKDDLAHITVDAAKALLKQQDVGTDSWTNEDE